MPRKYTHRPNTGTACVMAACRLVKNVCLFIYLHSGWVHLRDAIRSALGRSRAVVVCYHRIGDCDVLSRPSAEFRKDLEFIKRNYDCISLVELCERIRSGRRFNRRSVVITFDDGYRDNLTNATPVLKEQGMTATFFVATAFIGTDRHFPHDLKRDNPASSYHPKLTWDDLCAMQEEGFEIGSHTANHIDLGSAGLETVEKELAESLEALNTRLGKRPRAVSFPWGKPENIPAVAVNVARRCGYYAAVSAYGGTISQNADLYDVRRLDLGNGCLGRLAIRARLAGCDPDFLRLRAAKLIDRFGTRRVVRSLQRTRESLRILLPICGFVLLALAGTAQARSIYVSTEGNDNAPGTLARPLLSPARALELASPGDTICLRGGRYSLNNLLWVNKPGVTILSHAGEKAALIAPTTEDNNNTISVIVIVASNVSLAGLEIQGGSYYGIKVDVDGSTPTNNVQIRGCRVFGSGRDCIKTFNADSLLIEDCEIGPSGLRDPSNAEGIDSLGSVGVTVRRCYIHDTATNGVYLKGGARNGLVERCRIENTGGYGGILLGQDTDLEYMRDGVRHEAIDCAARNNVVIGTGAAGLGTYSGKNVRFENNTLYDVARRVQAGFWVVTNSRGVASENITFRNNIVVVLSRRPLAFVLNLAGRLDADSNIYYNPRGRIVFSRELTSISRFTTWSFTEWQSAMRVDLHSQVIDPLIEPSDLCKPRTLSPAIDHGEALVRVKEDYAGNPRPNGFATDIGAHEVTRTRAGR